jgi:hypothetical protein
MGGRSVIIGMGLVGLAVYGRVVRRGSLIDGACTPHEKVPGRRLRHYDCSAF